jgi:hypothetical protein
MKKFKGYQWEANKENPELAKAFDQVRATPGWRAFVGALVTCDQTVNELLDQNILDWQNAGSKIGRVNTTRNAWRKASTYGIIPPRLPRGWTTFAESGLSFRLYVRSSEGATLIARASRGQVLGIFDLILWDSGDQHVMAHMLQRPIRYPDSYLNYPWNTIMATDTIFVDDVWVTLDRVNSKVVVGEKHGAKKEVDAGK